MIGDKVELISIEILDWLISQPNVKEESITDSLLYRVSKTTPLIKYKAFTRNEESIKTGADWEWWFQFTKNAIRFRVPPQKMNDPKKNYKSSISYRGNTYNQYKKLIADSDATNSIPIYAIYTSVRSIVKCMKGKNDEGVYIGGANQIEKYARNKKDLAEDFLSLTIPLSCFFNCPLIIQDYSKFLEKYFDIEITTMYNNNIIQPGMYEKIPPEVLRILSNETHKIDYDYGKQYGVNALLYVDMRNNEESK